MPKGAGGGWKSWRSSWPRDATLPSRSWGWRSRRASNGGQRPSDALRRRR